MNSNCEFRDVFRKVDTNNDGVITIEELKEYCSRNHLQEKFTDKWLKHFDIDHDNQITYSEFEKVLGIESIKSASNLNIMNLNLSGKVAVITGASSGIGRATAVLFSKMGSRLALIGRQEEQLAQARQECISVGANEKDVICVKADIGVAEDVQRIADETLKYFNTINILVNNAGYIIKDTVENVDMSEHDRMMNVNSKAAVYLTHLFTKQLSDNKGSVVNVSSVNGIRSFPGVMSYCMSKAALDQFTRCAALDLAPKGVRVNSVNPGVTVTQLHKRSGMSDLDYKAFLEHSQSTHALGRAGTVDEVASAVAFLASDAASFITGASLPVDGGRHAMCPR